ncbi:unnamed protein product [Linum trigynum]|uniref:Phytocyanin domain-containing protein n=1 Tax=Linum trigynum TaxID=586398 RepID=A0AAV2C9V5_9ROSI
MFACSFQIPERDTQRGGGELRRLQRLQRGGAKVYASGNDQLTLAKGANYFICAIAGHCQANLKMTVNAS